MYGSKQTRLGLVTDRQSAGMPDGLRKDSRTKNMYDPGIYFISLTKSAFDLPSGSIIYIGKGDDVEKRLNQELGKRAGAATFFRSIGVMLGKKVIPGSGKNFKFYQYQEIAEWLEYHTEYNIIRCNWREQEKVLIEEHKPPFNYIYNAENYYPGLLDLRRQAKSISMNRIDADLT